MTNEEDEIMPELILEAHDNSWPQDLAAVPGLRERVAELEAQISVQKSVLRDRDVQCDRLTAALAASDKHCEIVADQNEKLAVELATMTKKYGEMLIEAESHYHGKKNAYDELAALQKRLGGG